MIVQAGRVDCASRHGCAIELTVNDCASRHGCAIDQQSMIVQEGIDVAQKCVQVWGHTSVRARQVLFARCRWATCMR